MASDPAPFVLIDDARDGGRARLYRAPAAIVRADTQARVGAALHEIGGAIRAGRHAAGFVTYDAAPAFEPALRAERAAGDGPLLWFGLFEASEPVGDLAAWLHDPAGAWIGAPVPEIGRTDYDEAFAHVAEMIAAGDIYQANLTFRARAATAGHPLALYAAIRSRAQAGYGGIVWTGERWLLSFSPELFFAIAGGTITARPMKGTARRGGTPETDAALARSLTGDAKQRAENLMIVDLLRNDLTRVAAPGSVAAPELFAIERYPTVLQMTSTVTAELAKGVDATDVIAAIFPCGSITGAPKIRAMEVIDAVEASPRGVYTGSIGWIAPDGDAAFNVAIRTLVMDAGRENATIGLGSGVVADSVAAGEWDECLAKGAFLTAGQRGFDLIETMAFDPDDGIALLDRHLARMKASADAFGFVFDRHAARNELQAATFRLRSPRRIRLVLAKSGAVAIESASMPVPPKGPVAVPIVPLPVSPHDFRLRHKTSDRGFYDEARHASGAFEAIFADPQGMLTEGSFTSLFVDRGGALVTPPLARGLLPGVLRAELLATGKAIEGDLAAPDLAGGFWIGNALRGLIPAVVPVAASGGPRL